MTGTLFSFSPLTCRLIGGSTFPMLMVVNVSLSTLVQASTSPPHRLFLSKSQKNKSILNPSTQSANNQYVHIHIKGCRPGASQQGVLRHTLHPSAVNPLSHLCPFYRHEWETQPIQILTTQTSSSPHLKTDVLVLEVQALSG